MGETAIDRADRAANLFELEQQARRSLEGDIFDYLAGGADDMRTVRANVEAFPRVAIRARRLVDVSRVDTEVLILGETWPTPIALAPVGFQAMFHHEGELATARAAAAGGHRMVASTVSSVPIGEIAAAGGPVWFQLYPTPDRDLTRDLLRRAERAGCPVVVLTVDVPVIGNRERGGSQLTKLLDGKGLGMGNFDGLPDEFSLAAPNWTWETLGWLRENCAMKIVLKGIVTREDAALAVEHGVDGLIVSNHGGRQEESDRSTLESLPEVAESVAGRIAVLFDGGIRRGTDVFKALALGADAVCIGRPICWGLASFGQAGVERVLEILRDEFERILCLAGVPAAREIGAGSVSRARG